MYSFFSFLLPFFPFPLQGITSWELTPACLWRSEASIGAFHCFQAPPQDLERNQLYGTKGGFSFGSTDLLALARVTVRQQVHLCTRCSEALDGCHICCTGLVSTGLHAGAWGQLGVLACRRDEILTVFQDEALAWTQALKTEEGQESQTYQLLSSCTHVMGI